MHLPFAPPLAPMLSSAADALPGGEGWQFEPKWDGFRTLVFRDGDEILLQSRDGKTMNRYFPELIAPLAATLSKRCVVDGEIVIVGVGGLDFETLLLRIHPAPSRVKLLSVQAPASFVAWDLLALGDDDLRNAPLAVRRERLEHVLAGAAPPVHLSPATHDRALAADWFRRFEGAGLDGVMAKRLDGPYRAGERTMIKVKHERTADCVVAGFRWHKDELKEQMRRIGLERQIAELVDNQQFRFAKVSEAILEPALAMRLCELRHQGRRWNEQHRIAGQDCLAPDRHCQMRLTDAGRPQQQHGLGIGNEAAGCQLADLLFVDRRLGGEVEAVEIAHEREARQPDAHLNAALILARNLALAEQR